MREDIWRGKASEHEGPRRDASDVDPSATTGAANSDPQTNLQQGLAVWLDVGLKLGKQIEQQQARVQKMEAALQRFTPVDYQTAVTGVYASPGPLILSLGSPDLGTFWEVESVIVGGTEVNISVAGAAGLYVTGLATSQGLGLSNAVDIAASGTLPNSGFYGRKDIVVQSQESLVVAIFNGTVGTTYVASASITVSNVAAAQGNNVVSL